MEKTKPIFDKYFTLPIRGKKNQAQLSVTWSLTRVNWNDKKKIKKKRFGEAKFTKKVKIVMFHIVYDQHKL